MAPAPQPPPLPSHGPHRPSGAKGCQAPPPPPRQTAVPQAKREIEYRGRKSGGKFRKTNFVWPLPPPPLFCRSAMAGRGRNSALSKAISRTCTGGGVADAAGAVHRCVAGVPCPPPGDGQGTPGPAVPGGGRREAAFGEDHPSCAALPCALGGAHRALYSRGLWGCVPFWAVAPFVQCTTPAGESILRRQ